MPLAPVSDSDANTRTEDGGKPSPSAKPAEESAAPETPVTAHPGLVSKSRSRIVSKPLATGAEKTEGSALEAVKLEDSDEAKVRAEYAAAAKGDDDDSKAAADAAKAMAAAIGVTL